MIGNLGKFAHPKKKASSMAKRPVSLAPQLGNQSAFPTPPKSKPDPVSMGVNDVSMAGAVPGKGGMPMGTIPENVVSRPAGTGTANKPGAKTPSKGLVHKRAKAVRPFFGSY